MSRMERRKPVRVRLATAVVGGLLLTGCASTTDGSTSGPSTYSQAPQIIGDQPDGGTPVTGGTLHFASAAPVATLDPITGSPSGLLGGTEMAAIYDTLMRWDPTTASYEPQLAESLTVSDDGLTWTLKLRDGVNFSDGAPVDAAAVVDSTNRYTEGKGTHSELFTAGVTEVVAVDPGTVIYAMSRPWPEFPSLLTFGYGMITSSKSYASEPFTPIGAGPYTVESFKPGSELVMAPRSDYWGGKPMIDKLRFVAISENQAKIDALKSGGIQMALLRRPDAVETAKAEFPGYLEPVSVIEAGQINTREGRPGSDVRVRKALSMAVDTEALNERVNDGNMRAGTDIFPEGSKWHGDVAGLEFDAEQARQLLDAAKADGYDGHITFVTPQTPTETARATALQAMWRAVGFDVEIRYLNNTTEQVRTLFVTHDFDVSPGGNGLWDAAPMTRLYPALESGSARNAGGFSDPQMDALIEEIMSATDDADKLAAIERLQTLFNETVPIMVWGAGANFTPWTSNVYGVKPGLDSLILLDKVWMKN